VTKLNLIGIPLGTYGHLTYGHLHEHHAPDRAHRARQAAPAALIVGMCLFGIGFGITQNVTFALMIDRAPVSGYGTASALWNLAYDAGYGAGPAVFGAVVARTGYPAAFALTGMLMLAALVPAMGTALADRLRSAGHILATQQVTV
jgi:MFS family permease